MALHLYIEKEKIIFASKDDKTSFGKAETALLSAKHNRLLSKTVKNLNSAVFFLVRKFYMLRCLLGFYMLI